MAELAFNLAAQAAGMAAGANVVPGDVINALLEHAPAPVRAAVNEINMQNNNAAPNVNADVAPANQPGVHAQGNIPPAAFPGGAAGPIDAPALADYLGDKPAKLPRIRVPSQSIVFNLHWNTLPLHNFDNELNGINAFRDGDSDYLSRLVSAAGDVTIYDYGWKLAPLRYGLTSQSGALGDPITTTVSVPEQPDLRNVIYSLHEAMKQYSFYTVHRGGLAVRLAQRQQTKCGHYFALVAPINGILWDFDSLTGIRAVNADESYFSSFARTNASIAATTAIPGRFTAEQYPATAGGAQSRIEMMKKSPFTIDWCYFPACRDPDVMFDGTGKQPVRFLHFDISFEKLHTQIGAQVFRNAVAADFQAELFYGPDLAGREYLYHVGTTNFQKQSRVAPTEVPGPGSLMPGVRMICIPEGPGTHEPTAVIGWDAAQTPAPLGTWHISTVTRTQFTFENPTRQFQDLAVTAAFESDAA